MNKVKPFQFKFFHVFDDQCGHKVGTDSLVLGAWIQTQLNYNPDNILDIGTGSGVLALMMAQHYPKATINAVEIDEKAANQAKLNCCNNALGEKISVFQEIIQNFQPEQLFDLIVSNPPFFKSTSKSDISNRQIARSQDELPLKDLFSVANKLANKKGCLATVLPIHNKSEIITLAKENGWFPSSILTTSNDEQPANRFYTVWSKKECEINFLEMKIREKGKYTADYITLTQNFHDRVL